jgi:hypothetical protein
MLTSLLKVKLDKVTTLRFIKPMKYVNFINCGMLLFALNACSTSNQSLTTSPQAASTPAKVIDLTQVGCQFLEVESQNYQYQPKSAADCKKINSETEANRKPGFKPLTLKAGKYIFRITNSNVPYELGFYLRGTGIKKVSLPKISGGGLTQGTTKDYEVNLTPGNYVFSCPLNPTPDYPIAVN